MIHVVRRGECFSGIARKYGFRDYRTLYDHGDNAALKKKRPNPNLIFPGDEIRIPDKVEREEHRPTGQLHRFQVRRMSKVLRLRVLAWDGQPLAGADYVLEIGDELIEGKTDGDGRLERAVDHDVEAILHIDGREIRLHAGALNPIADTADGGVTGVQGRLKNLGYDPGPVDGKMGRRTRGALTIFQADAKVEPTGKLDDATRAALEREHGC